MYYLCGPFNHGRSQNSFQHFHFHWQYLEIRDESCYLNIVFPVVQPIRLQIRELLMQVSRKRYWFLMTAAARWPVLFPSRQKILFPFTCVPHRSNFWRPFIRYRLLLCLLSSVSSGITHYANIFCVSFLGLPSSLFAFLFLHLPLAFLVWLR